LDFTRLRGFQDLIGPSAEALTLIEEKARTVVRRYGFREIRVPLIEPIELYDRSTGETSDIVQKQMYKVERPPESHGRGQMVLRPEGTPGVVRAYIEAGLDRRDPEQRYYYSGVMLRYERPQKGRYRQFYQFGVETFGRADAAADAELLIMVNELGRELGLKLAFEINSIGDAQCRPAFRQAVLSFGLEHESEICDDCRRRLRHNPLRLLDCKTDSELARSAPRSVDYLCEPCARHFGQVKALAAAGGVELAENPRLVRGLDYYTRTTFEVVSLDVGAQSAVVAGGRYDGLVEALGGASIPGTGFAVGVDRMALALEAAAPVAGEAIDAAMIAMGDAAAGKAIVLARAMRQRGLRVEMLSPERKLKALLGRADKLGARFAVIIGDNEIAKGVVVVRDLRASTQREVPEDQAAEAVAEACAG
jgi:histidyl-tRNA synthetase